VDKIHSQENVNILIAGEAIAQIQPDIHNRDMLLFALGDALLGALGQGGLKEFLNGSTKRDPGRFEDVLKDIEKQLFYAGWKILNVDISIRLPDSLEKTLNPQKIANRVSKNLFINSEQLNIKWNFQSPIEKINHQYECYIVILIGPRDS
jgi:2C-methyl-D-erythritol 2,4-cyclodiphosphate synthase